MLSLPIYLQLVAISLVVSIAAFFLGEKLQNQLGKVIELIAVPIIPCIGFFFGDDESHEIRIHVIFVLVISYIIFCGLFHLAKYLLAKIYKPSDSNHSNTDLLITLPIGKSFTIDSKFIDELPANVDSLTHMCEGIGQLTREFIAAFNAAASDEDKNTSLRSYFLGICNHIATLFDFNTRVHVRILGEGTYKKFVACEEHHEYTRNMSAMSLNNQMIEQSFNNKCSLIKTLNPDLHEEGINKNRKWKNYLMFALPQITHDGRPVFSVGISVTRKKNDLFYFLNYCEIETIVGNYIENIVENCSLKEFIDRYYFASS